MVRKVAWSYEAATDLTDIADYISKDSEFYAASFVREIIEASRTLSNFAERGRLVPEFGRQDIRELFIKGYRLMYQIEESHVVILGLIHGRRDLKSL